MKKLTVKNKLVHVDVFIFHIDNNLTDLKHHLSPNLIIWDGIIKGKCLKRFMLKAYEGDAAEAPCKAHVYDTNLYMNVVFIICAQKHYINVVFIIFVHLRSVLLHLENFHRLIVKDEIIMYCWLQQDLLLE